MQSAALFKRNEVGTTGGVRASTQLQCVNKKLLLLLKVRGFLTIRRKLTHHSLMPQVRQQTKQQGIPHKCKNPFDNAIAETFCSRHPGVCPRSPAQSMHYWACYWGGRS